MKLTDQELQKIAEKVSVEMLCCDTVRQMEKIILTCMTQVRDAQACARNQHTTQFCPHAEELAGKLKVARNSLDYAKYHLENGRVSSALYFIDEALERMGGE